MARKTLYLVGEPLDIVTLYEQTLKVLLRLKDGSDRKDIAGSVCKFTAWLISPDSPALECSSDSVDPTNEITIASSLGDSIFDEIRVYTDFIGTVRTALAPNSYLYRLSVQKDGTDIFVLNGRFLVLDQLIDTSQYSGISSSAPSTIVFNENTIEVQLGDVGDEVDLAREFSVLAAESADEAAESASEAAASALTISGLGAKGPYNAATNTPTLSGTPSSSLLNGEFYDVVVPGPAVFGGINFSIGQQLNAGDVLKVIGAEWSLIPFNVSVPKWQKAFMLPYSGNLVLDTINRKISTTGRIFVSWNLGYSDTLTDVQSLTDWDSTSVTGLHFIVYQLATKLFKVIKFDRITSYNPDEYVNIGYIETNSAGKIKVICDYPILVNGTESKPTFENIIQNYDIFSYNGLISIDSVNRKISVIDDVVQIPKNDGTLTIATQASADWDSDSADVLNYIAYDTADSKLKVIRQSRLVNYNIYKLMFLGVIAKGTSKTVECSLKGKYILNGNLFNMGFNSSYQMGMVMPFTGYLSITSTTRKFSVEGTVFVIENGNYTGVATQAEADWNSSATSGFHYIFFNLILQKIEIIRFDNSALANNKQNDRVLLGYVGNDSSTKTHCYVNGVYKLNGKIINNYDFANDIATLQSSYTSLSALADSLQRYKRVSVMRFTGDLVINTVARTFSTDGTIFVNWNTGYESISTLQTITAFISTSTSGIHFVLYHVVNKVFAIVRFDQIAGYSFSDYALVGFLGNDASGKVQHNISGNVVINDEYYPLKQKNFNRYGFEKIGALAHCGFDTDYSMLVGLSQSLFMGWEAHYALTTVNTPDTFMIGDRVWINRGNSGASVFTPLVATFADPVGESPIISMTNNFKRLFDKFNRRGKTVKFIATNTGNGGQTLEQLSKECTNGVTLSTNLYATTFKLALTRAKAVATGLGKTISCPMVFFAQGEYNYSAFVTGTGLTTGSNATTDKDTYKTLLTTLKNNMQADVISELGQDEKPLFFMYQTSGGYIDLEDMSISMAQLEFAQENQDVVIVNPHYAMPDYLGGHMSANGYRWWGELISKSLHEAFVNNKKIGGVVMKNITITDDRTIEIDFLVPTLPLVLDVKTTPLQTSYGFKVRVNGTEKTISSVSVIENKVILKFATKIATGTVTVAYAGLGRNGSGNLRDSDSFVSQYTYYDDSANFPPTYNPLDANNNTYYGKNYPLWNWAYGFYKSITY